MSEMFTFIKRRFSSNDLTSDEQENPMQNNSNFSRPMQQQGVPMQRNQSVTQPYQRYNKNTHRTTEISQSAAMTAASNQNFSSDQSVMNQQGKKVYPSAPSSPTRSQFSGNSSFNQQFQLNNAQGQGNNYFSGSMSQITKGIFSAASTAANTVRDKTSVVTGSKSKILLVIDEPFTDWSKIFRGRKLMDDYDIKVEQCQFKEITISVNSEQGCICNIVNNSGNKQARSFRPDFVLIRQHCSDINNDFANIISGLAMGQVYGLNSLSTVLHMRNKSWLFAHLVQIRNHLGKEEFPLINQSFHSSHRDLNSVPPLPCVVKIGEGHYGDAKMRIEDASTFQDFVSIAAMNDKYITVESFIDAKCDFIVQKIGPNYRSFMRKSISGSWKASAGSSMIEKMQVTDKMKLWVDEVSKLFGGLDICSVNGIISKSGEFIILGANGSDSQLLGESQEDDKRIIADMVVNKWNSIINRKSYQSMSKSPSLMDHTRKISNATTPISNVTSQPAPQPHQSLTSTNSVMNQGNISSPTLGKNKLSDLHSGMNPPKPTPPVGPPSSNTNAPIGSSVNSSTSVVPPSTSAYTSSLFNKNRTVSVDSYNFKTGSENSFTQREPEKNMMTTTSMTSPGHQPPTSSLFSKSQASKPLPNLVTPGQGVKSSIFSSPTTGPSQLDSTGIRSTQPMAPPPPPPPTSQQHNLAGNINPGGVGNPSDNPDDDTMKNLRKTFAGIFGDM